MNKSYKIIWNESTQQWVVASELASGKKKTKASQTIKSWAAGLIGTSALFALPAMAAVDIDMPEFRSNDAGYALIIDSDSTLNSNSGFGFDHINKGKNGFKTTTIGVAAGVGEISGSGSDNDLIDAGALTLGNKVGYNFIDKTTGNNIPFSAFDSNAFTTSTIADRNIQVSEAVGDDGQYVDRNLVQVTEGAVLDVNVGATNTQWYDNVQNNVSAIMKTSVDHDNQSADVKGSSIFDVSSMDASTAATLNYNSKTRVFLGNGANRATDAPYTRYEYTSAKFKGDIDTAIGAYTVNTVEEFAAYNDALIKAVQDGTISVSDYDTQLARAYDPEIKKIYTSATGIPETDAVRMLGGFNNVSYIQARGDGAVVNIDKDAVIQLTSSGASLASVRDGATLNNEGELGTMNNPNSYSYVINAVNNAKVLNNGVIDAGGTNPAIVANPGDDLSGGVSRAVYLSGSSTITNNGVINIAAREGANNYAIIATGESHVENTGSVNVSATIEPELTSTAANTYGINLSGKSSLVNSGEIYMGREAQRKSDDPTVDIDVKTDGNYLLGVVSASTVENTSSGQLVLGTKTQGASAVIVENNTSGFLNNGTIDVKGNADGYNGNAPLQNAGVVARKMAQDVVNGADGEINLSGINAVGMKALAGSSVTNAGTINITGYDAQYNTANYGMWAEGAEAEAKLTGDVNLAGDRAIGVHARNGGNVSVDGGSVNFVDGENQTGYYIYGAGSSVDSQNAEQTVTTKGSTLYRIDGGASYAASSGDLSAQADNSTILLSTGAGSNITATNMELTVDGVNATGVKVEAGGTATIDAGTKFTLSGAGATAGTVSGSGTSITGEDLAQADSVLISSANLVSGANLAAGAMGYKVSTGGTLNHLGTIAIVDASAKSTGVQIAGGTLENSGDISVDGTAVDVIGADSTVNNTGSVTATNGKAAYRLSDGASLTLSGSGTTTAAGSAHGILLDMGADALTVKDATITMDANGTGNGIENTAEIDGIHLDKTTINVGNGAGVRTSASLALENSGEINVNGSGTGLLFDTTDGTTTDKAYDMSKSQDLVINVESADGKGMTTNTSGDIKTGVSINVNNAAGGAALVIGGETKTVVQSGIIISEAATQAVDINNGFVTTFTNTGDIQSRHDDPLVMKVDSSNPGVVFTNEDKGNLSGKVQLLGQNNEVILKHGSTANTDFTTGTGQDKYTLVDIVETENSTLFNSIDGGDGADLLTLDNSVYTLPYAAKIQNIENVDLTNSSVFTLENTQLDLTAADSAWNIDGTSTLIMKDTRAMDFDSHLQGSGLVKVDLGDTANAFAFTANNMNDQFAGKVELTNSNFLLADDNVTALSDATLVIGEGNVTTVAKGTQTIAGLAFNGGTAKFDTETLGKGVSDALVNTTANLDLSGTGAVQVDTNPVLNGHTLPANTLNLLAQDDTQTSLQLASSTGSVTGSGGNLRVLDKDGNEISDAASTTVLQDGVTVANATYDYRVTGGDKSDGLYVNYGLTELELLTNAANALALTSEGLTGAATDLSAKVTGTGDLAIDTGAGNTVSLSNLANDYQGVTDVRSGTLLMANNDVLGQTSELHQAADTLVDMAGHSQTIGKLTTEASAVTDLNGGALTIKDGGTVDGGLKGEGDLNLAGGTLTIKGANAELAAATAIDSGAEAVLNDVTGLGSGAIADEGALTLKGAKGAFANILSGSGVVNAHEGSDVELTADNSAFAGNFDVAADSQLTATEQANLGTASLTNQGQVSINAGTSWTMANAHTGSGALNKNGAGVLSLTQEAAQFTGNTNVNAGGLQLGISSNDVTLASSQVVVAQGAAFGGFGGTAGNVDNAGTLTVGSLTPAPVLLQASLQATPGQTFVVGNNLNNSGIVNISAPGSATTGNTLHVKGDYVGNGGTININTQLGDDSSPTDKLVVDGSTSGSTAVAVTNVGGTGATTLNGIEVVSVGGNSAGEFTQKGRIVAGAYDYTLERGEGKNSSNWYLTNAADEPVIPDDGGNTPDDGGDTPDNGGDNSDNGGDNTPSIRPEAAAYGANMAAANNLFNMTLHDRMGETHYVDAFTGEEKVTSLWLRQVGGHTRSKDSSGQNSTQSNRYIAQLGGDIGQWTSSGEDRFHLGIMGGYANQKSNTRNHGNGYSADGSLDGYSVGLYGTWFQDNEEKTGAYVDSWVLYNWFDNTVSSKDVASESYKSRGFTASAETGYTWKVGEKNERESYYVQPQAQVTWMGVTADDHKEANGTNVQFEGDGNIQTRLGVRAFIKGHSKLDNGKDRTFEPFVEANWIHNTKNFGASLDGVRIDQAGTRNIGELKAGVEAKINKNVNLWGNVGQQIGDKGYSDTQATIGFKVNF
ncbi:autotransporter outer membrane beta-barrel domain-containing protein [Scandinavium manionii]|uniref:autotransporter outer membrane beta-barrel domain-containing protein n=1 Tax=Scandinavium manionii TaxID=2926520 RepID=UPI00216644FD|nr:autotransporter outer membrane beta-barrel domain-containing protein [Scandinavium manionii]MCS2164216.1 autotransporter outer membrane beta-barrel domain-containing protein [Scandinavium manionii]